MFNMHLGFTGKFDLHKGTLDPEGNELSREHISDFGNMILDTGLQRIGSNSDWMSYLLLGSGIQAPHPLQTTLQNITYAGSNLGPGNHTTSGINIENPRKPFCWVKRTFRVTPRGESRTYTELGIGWNNSQLFSRTLIKDPQGLPNTISILGDEYLDVTYEVRMYIPTDVTIHTVTPTGDDVEPRTVTVRSAMVGSHSVSFGWALAYSSNPSQPMNLLGNYSGSTHNQFYRGKSQGLFNAPSEGIVGYTFNYNSVVRTSDTSATFSFTRGLPDNIGELKTILVSQMGYCFQMELNPPFIKTDEEIFKFSYSVSWGRGEV